jgi:hypothetical protein
MGVAMSDDTADWVDDINRTYALVVIGGKARIARWSTNPLFLEATMIEYMREPDFTRLFSNKPVPGKGESQGVAWLNHPRRREYLGGVIFAPEEELPEGQLNLWNGFGITSKRGSAKPFLDFIHDVIAGGDSLLSEFIVAWLADAVQNPGVRPGTALVLRGGQGIGKSFFGEMICRMFGSHSMELSDPRHLTGNFNSHLLDKALIFVDEGAFKNAAAIAKLKNIVTSPYMTVEPKGVDSFETRNCLRVIIAGNDQKLISAAGDERRYAVVDVSDIHKEDHEYFSELAEWLENGGASFLLHFLKHHKYPTVNLRSAPRNGALLETKLNSLEPVAEWWYGRLCDGYILPARPWCSPMPTHDLHKAFCDGVGTPRDKSSETSFGTRIKKLAPGITKTRPTIKGERHRTYKFPSLEECREDFEKDIGHKIEWQE